MGEFIRTLHEKNGVVFHLEETVSSIHGREVKLRGGDILAADLVVTGIGVRPRTELAETAVLTTDRGVVVNDFLETSVPRLSPSAPG
ncbi:Ferredoxin reductase [Sinorhizobium alkalisoli]|nr:Ferredoxin reductase [Sinorhizobium alkalisoli]